MQITNDIMGIRLWITNTTIIRLDWRLILFAIDVNLIGLFAVQIKPIRIILIGG